MNITISGNLSGQTVFFLAGWPDTADVFRDNLMRSMEDTYRLVGLTLPGYSQDMPFVRHYQTQHTNPPEPTTTTSQSTSLSPAQRKAHALTERGLRRRPPRLATVPRGGYSFEALVDLLELAVDTALRTHNYAPDVIVSESHEERYRRPTTSSDAIPSHRLPPQYPRPIFIAHDWGCCLLFELLLRRPHFFSRVVALDVASSFFDDTHSYFALAGAQGLREQKAMEMSRSGATGCGTGGPGDPGRSFSTASPGPTATNTAVSTPAGQMVSPLFPIPHRASRVVLDEDAPVARPVSEVRAARRRTLASRYAMRTKSSRPVAWKQPPPGRLVQVLQLMAFALYQWLLIAIYLLVPTFIGRALVRVVAGLFGRPHYTHNPHLVVTPETEAVNEHVRHVSFQGAAHVAEGEASPLTTFMLHESLQSGHWHIILLPFNVPSAEAASGGDATAGAGSDGLAYQAYYFPPSARAGGAEDKGSSVLSATGGPNWSGINGVRSRQSRDAALRAQSEIVRPQPVMGYVYWRFWLGILASYFFSPPTTKTPQAKLAPLVSAEAGEGWCGGMGSDEYAELVESQFRHRHGHSPLISQRYDIPITVPILFIYGGNKPFMFHSRQFCAYVEYCKRAEDGISGVVEIKDGGHWFFADPRFRNEVVEHVWDFCQAVAL